MKLELGFLLYKKYETGHDKSFMLFMYFLRIMFLTFYKEKLWEKHETWLCKKYEIRQSFMLLLYFLRAKFHTFYTTKTRK
jgi:hypothetical protein